jgi:hypothetical protein
MSSDLDLRDAHAGRITGIGAGLIEATDDASIQVRRKVDPGPLFPWGEIESRVDLARSGKALDRQEKRLTAKTRRTQRKSERKKNCLQENTDDGLNRTHEPYRLPPYSFRNSFFSFS